MDYVPFVCPNIIACMWVVKETEKAVYAEYKGTLNHYGPPSCCMLLKVGMMNPVSCYMPHKVGMAETLFLSLLIEKI